MKSSSSEQNVEQGLLNIKALLESRGTDSLSILQHLPIPVCVTDADGFFKIVNQAYCDFYNYLPEDLLGGHFTRVVPEDRKALLKQLHDDFIRRRFELQGEWEVIDSEGNARKILSNAAFVYDEKGQPCKITFLLESGSDSRQLRESLLRLHQLTDAKEVKSTVSFYEKGMENEKLSPEELDAYFKNQRLWLGRLSDHKDKLISLVQTLDGLGRVDKHQLRPDYRLFDLYRTISSLLAEKKAKLEAGGLSIKLRAENARKEALTHIQVEADEIYIELMLYNLLLNAINTAMPDSEVEILMRTNGILLLEMSYVPAQDVEVEKQRKTGDSIVFIVARQHGGDVTFSKNEKIVNISLLLPIQKI
jgi:PAS domain S-box-containing protein